MQIIMYDEANLTLLTASLGDVSDQEWQTLYDALVRIIADSRRRRLPTIIMSFSEPSTSRPNANWRKKLAETRNLGDKSLRSFFVLVTSSMLLRGVMRAINWVAPKGDLEENYVVDNFDEGLVWLRARTGKSLLHVPGMYAEFRRKMVGLGAA